VGCPFTDVRELPKKTAGEQLDPVIRAGIETAVPGAGPLLGWAYEAYMNGPYQRRLDRWDRYVREAITELQDVVGYLDDDEILFDAIVRATPAAIATNQQVKLQALRNAVRNSVGSAAPDLDEQARFIRLVDEFSVAHLRMLTFYRDPAAALVTAGLQVPPPDETSLWPTQQLLEQACPEFVGKSDWQHLLVNDLLSAGLLQRIGLRVGGRPEAHMHLEHSRGWIAMFTDHLTDLGGRFLDYITASPAIPDPPPSAPPPAAPAGC
jgi:hypothetical protein